MTTRTTITAATLLTLAAATATADLYGGANLFTPENPLAGVEEGDAENNNNIRVFLESAQILAADLNLDHQPSGLVDDNSNVVPGVVPAGTRVESYFVHFDPNGTTSTETVTATIAFNSEILGVIFQGDSLNATDATVGSPATTYPTETGRQTEVSGDDEFEIAPDRLSITVMLTASANVDQMRIITAPSPRLVHEYNFEGNGFDNAGAADATPGSGVQYRRPDQGVPFALGQAYRMGSSESETRVFSIDQADFADFALNDFTIAFSIRRFQNDTGDVDFVLDARDTNGWDLVLPSGGGASFRNFRGTNLTFESPSLNFGSANDEWHHLAFVCDRSETDGARWYFDGELVSAADATAMIEAVTPDRDILIGGQSGFGNFESLDGQLGRLRFWNHALTTEQVQSVATEAGFFNPADVPSGCIGDLNGDGVSDVFNFGDFAFDFGCVEP